MICTIQGKCNLVATLNSSIQDVRLSNLYKIRMLLEELNYLNCLWFYSPYRPEYKASSVSANSRTESRGHLISEA
jgi:hypothetical protein